MLKEERLNYILNEVKVRNRVLLYDIAIKLNVSEDTIRRDLKFLDEQGKIKKVHGGAVSNSFHIYNYKEGSDNVTVSVSKKGKILLKYINERRWGKFVMEAKEVKIGKLDGSLFAIPAGYREIAPTALPYFP